MPGPVLKAIRFGMLALLATLAYIIGIGFWARPLIGNATLGQSQEKPA